MKKAIFPVENMSCATCAQTIEAALKRTTGVIDANVNFASEKVFADYDPAVINEDGLKRVVESIGYSVPKVELAAEDLDRRKMASARNRMILAWALSLPLLIFHHYSLYLAFPVIFIAGWPTLRSAILAARHRFANMDTLIALGSVVAYSSGILNRFGFSAEDFSMIGAMIFSFHLTGRYIEALAKGRSSLAIKKLLQMGAKTALILVKGEEKQISAEELKIGDIMLVAPGEKVPTDGVVVEGESQINESLATGESMPVHKKLGDQVIGGTVNQMGRLRVKATKVGKDTFLANVIKLVEESQGSKVPIQEFADKVTAYFVPAIIVLAVSTFIGWLLIKGDISQALSPAIAVLVIACPCALGLATPTALMVGIGLGAERGIIFRKGEALQSLTEIETMVFDKTGTITQGRPEVTRVLGNETLAVAASLEAGSTHPLAEAIVKAALNEKAELMPAKEVRAVPGKGVEGLVHGQKAYAGSPAYLKEHSIDISALASDTSNQTQVLVAWNGQALGSILIADKIKASSPAAIADLKKLGIKTVMLTGDNENTAKNIAREAGIEEYKAGLLPADKVHYLKGLKSAAMVGDGINDAPALTQAQVGIALGSGADIAIESADITLVSESLEAVTWAIKLAKATFNKIRQNLFWAFFYNLVAIPLAVMGLLHPLIAELAMAASSVSVVTNSNLLKRIRL
jgi:Cu+-exporting ATPase